MTREEWAKLSPEEQRIKVAELCGIKVESDGITHHLMRCTLEHDSGYNENGKFLCPVPDYLNDLNEIQRIVETLDYDQRCRMLNILIKICGHEGVVWRATAAQRAEAFVLTMEGE